MRRASFNVVSLLSLVVSIAAVVLGVRSYRFTQSETGESVTFRRHDPRWWVISHRGTFTLCRQNGKEWGKEFGKVEGLGFKFGGLKGPDGSLWNLAVPYWFVAAAGMVVPALWLVGAPPAATRPGRPLPAVRVRPARYCRRALPGVRRAGARFARLCGRLE